MTRPAGSPAVIAAPAARSCSVSVTRVSCARLANEWPGSRARIGATPFEGTVRPDRRAADGSRPEAQAWPDRREADGVGWRCFRGRIGRCLTRPADRSRPTAGSFWPSTRRGEVLVAARPRSARAAGSRQRPGPSPGRPWPGSSAWCGYLGGWDPPRPRLARVCSSSGIASAVRPAAR